MYNYGFGNIHQSEVIKGALPQEQNSPQHVSYGLFAEQLSGSAFTRARHQNLHTWLYRRKPSVCRPDFKPFNLSLVHPFDEQMPPNPMRWSPFDAKDDHCHFIESLDMICGNELQRVYLFNTNKSMNYDYFQNHDGELLIVPFKGKLKLRTEMGILEINPGMIAVIPRGIVFSVDVTESPSSGYVCENMGQPLTLPHLGLIGANGLAHPRHFAYPVAFEEDIKETCQLLALYMGKLWHTELSSSPLNVVAWHGNYAPYCYDLSLFNTINTVSYDHPDPSIFTVLSSESEITGVSNLDFVIFPERWMVAEHTFRPPYFHRNIMSEFMGLIKGVYDAKENGFLPGGFSIHNVMCAHGPDILSTEKAINADLKPERYKNTLAFMFESRLPWRVTKNAMQSLKRQHNYTECWQNF